MTEYLGDFTEDETVYIYFTTSDRDGGAVAPSTAFEAADIAIYKDGSATQKTSTNGLTMTSPFDSVTGLHLLSIDTSNDTGDAGFWVTGSDYAVILNPDETVDGQTVVKELGSFSIENRFMRGTDNAALASVLGALTDSAAAGDPTTADTLMQYAKQLVNVLVGSSGIATFPAEAAPANAVSLAEVIRAIHADVTGLNGDAMRGTDGANTTTPPTAAAIRTEMDSNSTQLAAIVADSNELQTDWADGGRLDLILDSRASQVSVDGIGASSGGSLNFEASGDNSSSPIKSISSVGTETGTYVNTEAENGSYHQITHAANDLDWVWSFNVGGGRTAVEVTFKGYLSGGNDDAVLQVYDHVGADWETIATIPGQAGTDNITITAALLNKHTGTGADLGDVYIRIDGQADDTSPVLFVDQLVVAGVNIGQSVGYSLGAVWVDSSASNTNTESFVDGVADNPVSTIAAAKTIADAVGISRFYVAAGSSLTLAASYDNYEFLGSGYSVALGGQSVSGTVFSGASISGNDDGSNTNPTLYLNCTMGSSTLGLHTLNQCGLGGTITLAEAGTYDWLFCSSKVAGTGRPNVDFGALIGNTNLNIRHYSGGMELQNFGATGTDNCTIEGNGQIVLNANCAGGTLAARGNFRITDNASGAVSIVPTVPTIDQAHQGEAQAGSVNTITLASGASSTDGFYDPGEVIIFAGTGAGQARSIIDYNGTTKVAVIDKDWRTNPDSSSQYVIRTKPAELHVNEGQAQAGAATTITLNTAASATDDIYIGQSVFLMGGTGQDQARIVTDYNGTTKVATVHKAWDINPDSTTSYVMVPLPTIGEKIVDIETDTQDIQSRIPAALVSGRMDSNVSAIDDNATSATNLSASALGIDVGACEGTPTTTVIQTDLSETTDDHYNGRVVVFTSGAAKGQATDITDYTGSTGTLTVTALTTAPSATDSFVIV